MMQVETSVVIRRPIEAVFTFVSDVRNSGKWQMGLCPITLETATRTKMQTSRRRARPDAPPPAGNPGETTLFEPNRKVGIRSCSGPFEFDEVYHFEPTDEGTIITWTCQVQASDRYRFVEPLVGQVVAAETQVSFLILKNLMEGTPESESKPA